MTTKTKCSICKKFISDINEWICEECGCSHCLNCSGASSSGTGEYPDEDSFSVCKKCYVKNNG